MFIEAKGDNPLAFSTGGQAIYMTDLQTAKGGAVTITTPGTAYGKTRTFPTTGANLTLNEENYVTVWMNNRYDFANAMSQISGEGIPGKYIWTPDGTKFFKTQEELDAYIARAAMKIDPPRYLKPGALMARNLGADFKKIIPIVGIGLAVYSARAEAAEGDYLNAGVDIVGIIPTPLTEAPSIGRAIGDAIGFVTDAVPAAWAWWTTPTSHVDQELAKIRMQDEDPGMYQDLLAGKLEWNGNEYVYDQPDRP
jgi:hypothetical protein